MISLKGFITFFILILFSSHKSCGDPGIFDTFSDLVPKEVVDAKNAGYSAATVFGGVNKKVMSGVGTGLSFIGSTTENVATGTYKAAKSTLNTFSDIVKDISQKTLTIGAEFIVKSLNLALEKTHQDVIKLPEIDKSFFGLGSLKTSEGELGLLSTLDIAKDITWDSAMPSILLNIPVKLKELYVEYPEYKFSLLNFGGKLSFQVPTNSLMIRLSICIVNGCVLNVRQIEVVELENYKIDMGKKAFDRLLNTVADYLKGIIKTQVQNAIDEKLKDLLGDKKFVGLVCNRINPQKFFSG